jgi:hypothetical protein
MAAACANTRGHGRCLQRSAHVTRLPPRARPTFYRGAQMRSRLEATVAEWLDAQGLVWKYEGPAYGNQDGQYLPDFQISGLLIEGVPHALYFDVKPPGKEREQPGLIGRTLNKRWSASWQVTRPRGSWWSGHMRTPMSCRCAGAKVPTVCSPTASGCDVRNAASSASRTSTSGTACSGSRMRHGCALPATIEGSTRSAPGSAPVPPLPGTHRSV